MILRRWIGLKHAPQQAVHRLPTWTALGPAFNLSTRPIRKVAAAAVGWPVLRRVWAKAPRKAHRQPTYHRYRDRCSRMASSWQLWGKPAYRQGDAARDRAGG